MTSIERTRNHAALQQEVRELVAAWPPLSDLQCRELARLLGPYCRERVA